MKIVVISPDLSEKEYTSVQDFWRSSKYSQSAIRKALIQGKPMSDGTRIRVKEEPKKAIEKPIRKHREKYVVLVFKGSEVEEFTSFQKVREQLGISAETVKKRVEDGKEYKGYTFDILE